MPLPEADNARRPGGLVRLLTVLLTLWEPVVFAVVAAGAFNAIAVRGLPVAAILLARLVTTALCVGAGRALADARPSAAMLTRLALGTSAVVQVFAYTTRFFPSNRLPGETSIYVAWTLLYYGAWFVYTFRSKQFAAIAR